MNWKARSLLIAVFLSAALAVGILFTLHAPGVVLASPPAAVSPQVKLTILDVPSAVKNIGGEYVKIGDVGIVQVENSASLVEAFYQGRLYVKAIQGNDDVYFQLRLDDLPAVNETGQAHVTKREQNLETSSAFAGYWQGLAAGQHTVSIWARTGSLKGSASGVTLDYLSRPDNLVIVKEYLPYGATYLPSVAR